MGRGSVRHQPRASSPTSWRSAAAALLLLAAFALADASQLDEDLTFDEEAVGVARIRREAEVAPVAPPYQEVPSAKATLTKRQSGWGFWGSSSDDEDDDVGSAIEGSGVEKVIYRVKFQVNLTWRVEYSNKQGTYFRDLATEIRNAFEIILRPVSGDKTLFVSNMKRTPTNYVEVTMDINYEGFGDQSGALERRIREALGTSRLGSIPVNTQFFRFEDHGSAVTSPTACPPGKWRCSSGRCVGRCDGRDDCLDKSDEQDCITSSSSSITGSKADEGCRGDDQFRCAGPDDVYVCEVQRCDGHADCPEGDDEEGCDCAPGNFVCDGVRCVPNEKKCDGTRDCVDNSDEENCDCPSTMFSCDQGSVCIDLSKTCDNRADCYDGTDELGCATVVPCRSDEFTCKDGSCVASFRRCDYIQDCPDGEDESFCPCEPPNFECISGMCITPEKRCDGVKHCDDGSDEEVNCPCSEGEFSCLNGQCVAENLRCDGEHDCDDQSDEVNCSECSEDAYLCGDKHCIPKENVCDGVTDCDTDELECCEGSGSFECESDGTCLGSDKMCNGIKDCPNGEDEKGCPGEMCQPGEYRCKNGDCIPISQRCDGLAQCRDQSDESGCPCDSTQWTCGDGTCIPQEGRCNGRYECRDYSDEEQCPECSPGEWTCRSGDCIPASQRCDRVPHCRDGSDEENCLPPPACTSGEWRCSDGTCIPLQARCDGRYNCPDYTDEEGCSAACGNGEWTCEDRTCIPQQARCDGRYDCPDYTDENGCQSGCSPGEWTCRNGDCIPDYQRCDRTPQCLDRSDEENCRPEPACGSEEWTCRIGTCIPVQAVCDGRYDCPDYTDEEGCPVDKSCSPGEWTCRNGDCIPDYQRCDRTPQCLDRSDEENCRPEPACGSGEWTCRDGTCIPEQARCDGLYDCPDYTDEDSCQACMPEEFACHDDGICIPKSLVCDGRPYCRDDSDEKNCSTPSQCPEGEFQCADGICIPSYLVCDGHSYCRDGSDEWGCSSNEGRNCTSEEFTCRDGTCINSTLRCNGQIECPDSSDEFECSSSSCGPPESFRCAIGYCIRAEQRCDGTTDCQDASDERDCPPLCTNNEFRCGDGTCIPRENKCNGRPDCRDQTDEDDCTYTCRPDQFRCENGECLDASQRCNGREECNRGEDERGCACGPNEFTCVSSGLCISEYGRCDGRPDCRDGSDEQGCETLCHPVEEWQCANGQCIPSRYRCDGRQDCADNSDELDASCVQCRTNEFQCKDGACISSTGKCNGYAECLDGSDEQDCDLFQCADGNYINDYLRCDGRRDCNDGSDEVQCAGTDTVNLRTYPSEQTIQQSREVVFQCRDEGPIRAPVRWSREGNRAMPVGTTDNMGRLTMPNIQIEHQGTYYCEAQGVSPSMPGRRKPVYLQVIPYVAPTLPPVVVCSVIEATCMNGQCIDKDKVCDGVYDCDDASDEMRCNPLGCEPNEYQCDNKRCVLKTWLCDSDDDCGDGSDERECVTNAPGSACRYNEFTCLNGSQCIPKSFHCDGEVDCLDGSDEQRCTKPIVVEPPPRNIMVQVGETFTITCRVIGVPTPTVIWRLNWGHVPDKCQMTSVDGQGALTCPGVQPTDQGAYSCEAINSLGSVFAQPDCIVQVKGSSPQCQPPLFNAGAVTAEECLTCFCFGATEQCYSTDRYITQLPPPANDSYQLIGVNQDQFKGNYIVRTKQYQQSSRFLSPQSSNAVQLNVDRSKLEGPSDLIVYFSLPDSHKGQQLTSYGGYLRYKIKYSSTVASQTIKGPDVIMVGNDITLMHVHDGDFKPDFENQVDVRFEIGQWFKRVVGRGQIVQSQEPANREEIMMVLENIELLLIRALYTDAYYVVSTLSEVQMDTAVIHDNTQGRAVLVEECRCPTGYVGLSCQDCAPNYKRVSDGPWLGRCVPDVECRPGEYGDPANGIPCLPCPCPLTTPTNQFSSTCFLDSDGQVTCNCLQGYQGRRCEVCASGYEGNPNVPGDSCRPAVDCNPSGSYSVQADPVTGLCQCKELVTGPKCDRCQPNTFFLNDKTRFGCIDCFCMGITKACTSSNWYRQQESVSFTNDRQGFELVDKFQEVVISNDIYVDSGQQEIVFSEFSRLGQEVYYWNLPQRFLGDKLSSYGGNLTYSLRYVPAPGGQSSANSAAAVEIFGNDITLRHFTNGQLSRSLQATVTVPLYEDEWERQDGQKANREHFLMVLADLEYIHIKATYTTNTQEVALKEVIMDHAEPRNTGQERAFAVEFCECPPGYKGLSCEDCDVGYTRRLSGVYLGECVPCECNGHSEECDPDTSVCSNCRDNTSGDFCELCAPGFVMNRLGRCEREENGYACNCDPRGSLTESCQYGICQCKANVRGEYCDACEAGYFDLSEENPDGCLKCWCSGATSQCFSSNYYRTQLPMQLLTDHGFTLSNRLRSNVIREGFGLNLANNEISFDNFDELSGVESYYWSLPQMFTGNRLASYGGNLTITQRYIAFPGSNTYADPDVIIRSAGGLEFIWMISRSLPQNALQTYTVPLIETSFTMNQQPASRSEFLKALSSIEAILVRATPSNRMRATFLRDVIMDTAVPSNTGQPRAVKVEQCQCPPEYSGLSCEQCRPGYYRDIFTNTCEPCRCNGHEESCTQLPSGEVRCKCLPGYYGNNCEGSGIPTPSVDDGSVSLTVTTPTIQVAAVGSTIQMHCQARSLKGPQNRVSVTWNRANGELPYGRAQDNRQGLLVISEVQVSDSGTYICTASDGFHIVTKTTTLEVGGGSTGVPRVTIEERREILELRRGQTLEVRCSAQGSPRPQVVWSHGPNRERLPFNVQQQNGVLIFRNADVTSSGEYYCTATNSEGTNYARIIINVIESGSQTLPERVPVIIVQVSEQEVEVNAGETVRVSCSSPSPGQLRIKWSRLGGTLPSQSSERDGLLSIPNARAVDSGIYVCRISDERSSFFEESSTRITISETWNMPTVQIQPDRQTVNQGSEAELTCIVTGSPPPEIKWSKVNDEFGVGVQIEGNVLRIVNAVVSDRGMYVCTAENAGGVAQTAAIVEVERREPPEVQIYPQVKQTIVAGANALFQCHLIGGIPTPTVRWARTDGRPLSLNTEILNGGVLRFNQVLGDEEGSYTCTAENDAGKVTAVAVLEIQSLPVITIRPGPSPYTLRVGERMRLECSARGEPSPSVTWQKLEVNFPTTVPSQSTAPNVAIYEVPSASKSDSGTYQCSANNAAGLSEERIQIIVEDVLPAFKPGGDTTIPVTPEAATIFVPIGGNYEFSCLNQGPDASSTIYDFRRSDNRPLPRGYRIENGVLYLTNVDQSASGEYACVGSDRISGRILFTIYATFEVIAPPRITLDPARQIVRPGDLVRIRCTATGPQPITINWSKEGGYMPRTVIINGGEMMFRGIETSDAGRYICQAVNNAGTARAVAEVVVNEEPLLTAIQQDIVRFVGQTAELRCEASGIDPNAVSWSRLRGSLPSNAVTRGNLLRLTSLRPEDSGQYQCQVSGPTGFLSSVITLNVMTGRQTMDIRIIPSRSNVRIGDDIDLTCEVSGQAPASVTWRRINSRLPLNAQPRENVLRLINVQANYGGIYQCVVTTSTGVFEENFPLAIQGVISAERVDFEQNQRSVMTRSVAFGLGVVMECNVNLTPPVSYTWSKQGGELPVNSLVENNILNIPEVHTEDAGLFVCTASNTERSLDQATLLVVTGVIPRFAENSYLSLPTLPRAYLAFDIEISFKPESGDGLILYNSQRESQEDGDFVSFGLSAGYAEFRFDVGSGPAIIKSRQPLALNKWHTVKLSRDRKKGSMIVDDGEPIMGSSVGRFLGLDLVRPLYLGGVPDFDRIHQEAGFTTGYSGCIARLVIRNSLTIDLMRDSKTKIGIRPCETCIGNPCQNNGVCQEAYTEVGHKCICPAGFSGGLCENTGEACYPGVCGTGRCVNKPGGFECFCPFGKFGQRCERDIMIQEPAFGDGSYIAYQTPRALKRFSVDLNFKPESLDDGLLMYCSQKYRGEGDFASLAIRNKRLEFRFNTGSGTATLQSEPLFQDEWVEVRANRTDRRGSMTINGGQMQNTESPGSNRGLNLITPLYIGGVDNTRVEISPEVGVEHGFKGCVKEIKIMDQQVRMAESLVDSANVGQCGGATIAFCSTNPCLNNGQCSEDPGSPHGYSCSCQEGYSGHNCEMEPGVCTIIRPCKNGASCVGSRNEYSCNCPLGFAGQHCEHNVDIRESASFSGDSWVEFDKLMLPQEDGLAQKVTFEFSTIKPDGLLFWYGQEPTVSGRGQDYISVAIKDGIIEFTFDVGTGPAMVRSPIRVDDGERHSLTIERTGRQGLLELDSSVREYGQSPGILHMLNAEGNIYIGGVPDLALMTDGVYTTGFQGCIHRLSIGEEQLINFMDRALSGVNVKTCPSFGGGRHSTEGRNSANSGGWSSGSSSSWSSSSSSSWSSGGSHGGRSEGWISAGSPNQGSSRVYNTYEKNQYTRPAYNRRTYKRTEQTTRKVYN